MANSDSIPTRNVLGQRVWRAICNSDESAMEEIEEIVDLTLPTPSPKKKKLITKFFKPTKTLPQSGGRPSNFLQHCNPRPVLASGLATSHSSTLPSSSKGPTTEVSTDGKKKGAGTRSAVSKTYTLLRKLEVLQYVANSSETIQAAKREEHFEEKAQEWSWPSDYLWRILGHVTLSVGAGNAWPALACPQCPNQAKGHWNDQT